MPPKERPSRSLVPNADRGPTPFRVGFFGMDGRFAETVLEGLCRSGLKPKLVVVGHERNPHASYPTKRFPAYASVAGLCQKLFGTGQIRIQKNAPGLLKLAHRLGIDVLRTDDINDRRAVRVLRKARLDAFMVASFPKLLSPPVLAQARHGGINLHPGRLPEERGPAPLFWALKKGCTRIRYTVHQLDNTEDSGPIIFSEDLDFRPGQRAQDIMEKIARAALPQVDDALRDLVNGRLQSVAQGKKGSARCPRPRFIDGRIDPTRPAQDVYVFVAGTSQYHRLFVDSGGERFFIADALSYDPIATSPVEYALTGDRLVLTCNPGVVELKIAHILDSRR